MFSTLEKGPRYLEMAEGYVLEIGLDENSEIIGYKFVHLGKMMRRSARAWNLRRPLPTTSRATAASTRPSRKSTRARNKEFTP